ncbi:hypothetical protein [Paraflavitalea speifideaquila]|uniref:RNA polymerase sigma factor n=1 Tax=Paraflavitalea speifideaquila TaxID=3076558 RepID=UPI0028E5A4E9|nr:hypothetical protein [Paraflavitalea speifideiaquila]
MDNSDFEDELVLLEGLKSKNIKAFSVLYKTYSEDLLLLAYTLTGDPALCHQVVDNLFIELWEKGTFTQVTPHPSFPLFSHTQELPKHP